MSEHIKKIYTRRIEEFLEKHPIQDGQLFAVQYDSTERADQLASAFAKRDDVSETKLVVEDVENRVLAYESDTATTMYLGRVLSKSLSGISEERDPIQVTQAGGTTIRNHVLGDSHPDKEVAGFVILDRTTNIETMEAAEFLSDEGGLFDPAVIYHDLLDPETVGTEAGSVVLLAMQRFIIEELIAADETSLLDEVAELRVALENKDVEHMGEALGRFPDLIEIDVLPDDFFDRSFDQEKAVDDMYSWLEKGKEHVEDFREAFGRGAKTEIELQSDYSRDFISKQDSRQDWTHITLEQAERGSRSGGIVGTEDDDDKDSEDESGPSSDDDDESDSSESGDGEDDRDDDDDTDTLGVEKRRTKSTSGKNVPSITDYSVTPSPYHVLEDTDGRFTNAVLRHVLRCPAGDADIEVTVSISEPMGKTEFVTVPEKSSDSVKVDSDKITFNIEVSDDDVIQWSEIELYIDTSHKRGHPDLQFHIAILPEWWYETLGDVELDIDYEGTDSEFILYNEQSIQLSPPAPFDDREEQEEKFGEDGMSFTVDRPVSLFPQPPLEDKESVSVQFSLDPAESSETEVTLPFRLYKDNNKIPTRDLRLPLAIDAVVSPDQWEHKDLIIDVDQVSDGMVRADGKQFIPSDPLLRNCIAIEEDFISADSVARRSVSEDDLTRETEQETPISLPDDLESDYNRLLSHFEDRGTTPSTDPWDGETQTKVRGVVESYVSAGRNAETSEDFGELREIAVVSSRNENKCWLSAFHPIMLSYGLRLAQWRDKTLANDGLTGGFDDENLATYLTPSGLLPYRSLSPDETDPLRGLAISEQSLWMSYSPTGSHGAETPDFMESLVSDKVYDYYQTFSQLFEIHPDRPITINFQNLGDLEEGVKGLYDVFERIEEDGTCPPIEVRVYGSSGEGRALDKLFTSDYEHLEGLVDFDDHDDLDRFRNLLTYTHAPLEKPRKSAQLTFFRGILDPTFFDAPMDELPDRLLQRGLLPQEASTIESQQSKRIYKNGFGDGLADTDTIYETACLANRLEYGYANNEEYGNQSKRLRKVESGGSEQFDELLTKSSWAIHLQPPVGIEFYTDPHSDIDGEGTAVSDSLVIHYDDTLSETPGYDVITTTSRQDLYVDALRSELEEIDQQNVAEPRRILNVLAAIEGGSVTELQRARSKEIKELIGMAGTLVLSQKLLEKFLDDYVWVAINLANEVQHDRSRRSARPRVFRFDENEEACDDLLFVGVPRSGNSDEFEVKLWVAEAKGGTASASSGVGQVNNTVKELGEAFDPSEPYADTGLLRTVLGRLVTESTSRLGSYSLLDNEAVKAVSEHEDTLLNGDFTVTLLTDATGARGVSVSVGKTELKPEIGMKDGVRTLTVPAGVFGLLTDGSLDDVFQSDEFEEKLRFNE